MFGAEGRFGAELPFRLLFPSRLVAEGSTEYYRDTPEAKGPLPWLRPSEARYPASNAKRFYDPEALMARPRRIPIAPENRLLAALPPREYRRLRPHLQSISLQNEQILAKPGEPFSHAYFPAGGIISVLVVTAEGGSVEVGMVGKEGMVGLTILFGGERAPIRAVVQCPGEAWMLPADYLRDGLDRNSVLYSLLLRYADAYVTMVMHAAACNHFHTVEQRLAYWLLLTQDRLGKSEFPLTQQLLGRMLGVRRMSITPAARKMQQTGLIRYRRGHITILDCPGLEAVACSCYRIVRERFDALPKS